MRSRINDPRQLPIVWADRELTVRCDILLGVHLVEFNNKKLEPQGQSGPGMVFWEWYHHDDRGVLAVWIRANNRRSFTLIVDGDEVHHVHP